MSDRMIRADGRQPGLPWDNAIKQRVRIRWCLEGGLPGAIEQAADEEGVPLEIAKQWLKNREPDGTDWEIYRQRMGLSRGAVIAKLTRIDSEWEVQAEVARAARDIMIQVMATMQHGALYLRRRTAEEKKYGEDVREPVAFLYTQNDQEVQISNMRPRSLTEASKVLKEMGDVFTGSFRRLDDLDQQRGAAQAMAQQVLQECLGVVLDLYGAEQLEVFKAALVAAEEERKVNAERLEKARENPIQAGARQRVAEEATEEFPVGEWEDEALEDAEDAADDGDDSEGEDGEAEPE